MTQEEKQLVIKDLSARLPYGVMVLVKGEKYFNETNESYIVTLSFGTYLFDDEDITLVPYLRPMSSMMQGEWEEMTALIYPYGRINRNPDNKNELLLWLNAEGNEMPIILINNVFSWLNSHHFDYRGLIPMGLALEAPEGMYK